jgi:arylsulfatase A-like enzyme
VDELEAVRDAVGRRVDFTRATSPAAQTFYSLSSTIRGKPVRELVGEQGHTLWRDRDPTLADALRAAGYRPLTVVTNLRWASQYGVTGGFDVLWPTNYAARDLPHIERVNERFVDAATAFTVALTAVKETKGPVFCWLHLMEPHYPFHHGKDSGPTNRQGYQRSLRYVGALAARFVEEFRARRPDPIIALFGDHGEEFGEHGGLNHGNTVYADQVRVGFSLSLPGDLERQVDAPVSIAQLPATILEQLGLPIPASMTEPSLLAGLYGDDSAFPQVAVSEMPTPTRYMVSYTGARYRLVTDAFHDTEELFDTLHDPLESHDISAQQPRALHAMQALANAWNERH